MADILRYILLIEVTVILVLNVNAGPLPDDISDETVPLMFRRNDFFLKAAKSVPRIGRRNDFSQENLHYTPGIRVSRRNDFFLKAARSIPRIGRRDYTPVERDASIAWPWFRDHDFIPKAMKKNSDERLDISSIEEDPTKEKEEPRLQAIV